MFAGRPTAFSALSMNTSATFLYIITPQSQGNRVIQSIQMQACLKANPKFLDCVKHKWTIAGVKYKLQTANVQKKQHIQQTTWLI